MADGEGAFTDSHWLKLCIQDTAVQHVISNAGYGSGRAGTSPGTAIFFKELLPVRKGDFGTVYRYDLPSPESAEAALVFKGFPGTQNIEDAFKAFLKNCVVNAGAGFAESLLGTMGCLRDGEPHPVSEASKESVK